MNRTLLLFAFVLLLSVKGLACSCTVALDDSFKKTVKSSDFVALVKVISFDEFLNRSIIGYEGRMPYAMTVEVVKKYTGTESRQKITIVGDNGMLCRPYLGEFKIGAHYLIAPLTVDNTSQTDYTFFSCRTDYLNVDLAAGKAIGNYSLFAKEITLADFEEGLKSNPLTTLVLILMGMVIIIALIFVGRSRRPKPEASS